MHPTPTHGPKQSVRPSKAVTVHEDGAVTLRLSPAEWRAMARVPLDALYEKQGAEAINAYIAAAEAREADDDLRFEDDLAADVALVVSGLAIRAFLTTVGVAADGILSRGDSNGTCLMLGGLAEIGLVLYGEPGDNPKDTLEGVVASLVERGPA